MANITRYKILIYGSPEGYQGNRAQIALYQDSQVVGFIRFHDQGTPLPDDERSQGKVVMHLPAAMFESVVDVLRHEKPLDLNFRMERAMLGTSDEPVGEGE
jgi:hypothetical protein